MKPKRTVLLLVLTLFANLALLSLIYAFAILGFRISGRYGVELSLGIPSIGALISFLWILSRSASVKSVAGRIALTITGSLVMFAVFLVLVLPAIYVGMELSNKLHRAFPHAFPSPEGRRP